MLLTILLGITTIIFFLGMVGLKEHYSSALEETDLSTKSPEQLRNMIKCLRIDYKEAKVTIQQLEKNRGKATELEKKLSDSQSKIAALQADKVILDKQLIDAEQARKALIEELSGASGQIEASFIEITTWNALVAGIKQIIYKVNETEIKIQQIMKENKYLDQRHREVCQQNEGLNKKLNDIRKELELVQEEVLNAGRIDSTEPSASPLVPPPLNSPRSEDLSKKISELEEIIRGLEVTIGRLQAQVPLTSNFTDQDAFETSDIDPNYVDFLEDLADYLQYQIQRLRQEKDRLAFRYEFFQYAGYNLWGDSYGSTQNCGFLFQD